MSSDASSKHYRILLVTQRHERDVKLLNLECLLLR